MREASEDFHGFGGLRLPDRLRADRLAARLGDLPAPRSRRGHVHGRVHQLRREHRGDVHLQEGSDNLAFRTDRSPRLWVPLAILYFLVLRCTGAM